MSDLTSRVDVLRDKQKKKRACDRVAMEVEAAQAKVIRDKKRVEMRNLYPNTAKVVDAFRDAGVEVRVLSVKRVDDE